MSNRLPPQGRIPEDDDGIPLEGIPDKPKSRPVPERAGVCWVCQCPVTIDQATRVAKKALPVCAKCWNDIPPGERVKIGLQIIADEDSKPLKQIAAAVLARIKGDAERAVDGNDDPFGIFTRGN